MTVPSSTYAEPRRRPDYSVVVSARGFALLGCFVMATLAGVLVVDRASQVFVLLGTATTAAVIAVPFVESLARWIPRGAAIVIITLIGIIGTVGVLGGVAWDLNRQASALSDSLHAAVADLPPDSAAARTARDFELDRRIDGVFDTAATRLVVGETDPVAVAGQVARVVVVGVLAAFIVAGGRQLTELLVRLARRTSIRAELHSSLQSAIGRSGTYLRRMISVSVLHGLAAALMARSLGLPGPISIGAWVTVASTVPILGGALAWLPVVGLASAHDIAIGGAIVIALFFIVADRLARAHWAHRPLRVGPLIALVGIGAGYQLIGVSGALLGLLVAAFVSAMLSERGHLAAAVTDLIEDPDDRTLPEAETERAETEQVVSEPHGDQRYVRLRLSGRTMVTAALAITGAVAVVEMAVAAQSLIVWFAVGGFVAAGIDRPISAMHRSWKVPRAAGTTIVLGALVGIVAAVVVLAGPSITSSAATVASEAPEAVRSMETLPVIGRLLEENGAPEKVEEFLGTLPDRLRDSGAVERIASAAGDGLAGAFWTISFLLAILWDGPRLVAAARDRVPAPRRLRVTRLGRAAYTALSNVVAAAAFVAALNGTVVMLLAVALGIPLAPVLGLWAAAWNFIPQIGGFVGGLPLVALGFAQGPWQGVIALVAFVTYQTFENHVIQPVIGSRVVHVTPLVLLIGVLFGGALGGFVGALMAGPILGVAKVATTELGHDRARIEDRVTSSSTTSTLPSRSVVSNTATS
ncbi:MAG TPA: AI-2E family transporter [Ilumatobacteraceae bacterium]